MKSNSIYLPRVLTAAVGVIALTSAAILGAVPAQALTTAALYPFQDNFNGASDMAPLYGLNDALVARQGADLTQGYTRVSGTWTTRDDPPKEYSQVNNNAYPNKLSFWVRHSAVRVDTQLVPDATDSYSMSATVNPDVGNFGTTSGDWVSLMFANSADRAEVNGYVADPSTQLGVTVRRSGQVDFFLSGQSKWSQPLVATKGADGYKVKITVTQASTVNAVATVTVNGVSRSQALGKKLPSPYPYLGAYISNGSATAPYKEVSTIDDLALSNTKPYPNLQYFGTYATKNGAETKHGNHIREVESYMNAHWVNLSPTQNPVSGAVEYDLETLKSCPIGSCIVYTGNEFWNPERSQSNTPTGWYGDPAYSRWNTFLAAIAPYQDRILAYYMKDEPHFNGATVAEVQESARVIKQSMISGQIQTRPIMLNLTYKDLGEWRPIPQQVDWLGFDHYSLGEYELDRAALRLDEMTEATDRTFLMPPNVHSYIDEVEGANSTPARDAAVADYQRMYLRVAASHPKVIGLLSFGLWVEYPPTLPEDVPITTNFQKQVGAVITPRG
ncbi:hypothetical protein [Arthrobacter glacialis]|uniref:hypothetical protein n=1 Tax=Arthrobacter glacialis TaxID=1664 RepID=UPI000CD3C3AD|nr:hypothetical protein [Arthrobacter glacialis]POH58252.1 hypothetical protein CVS28_12470 [Arthrobacter glacialis]